MRNEVIHTGLMRTEVFAATTDDEAKGYLYSGAASAGTPIARTHDVTALELDLLHAILTDTPLKRVLREPGGGILAYGGTEGPWVEAIRPSLTDALAALADDRLAAVAEDWHNQRDLAEADPAFLAALLRELVALARQAREHDRQLYLRNALDTAG